MVDLNEKLEDTQDTVRSKKEKARKPQSKPESNTANSGKTIENTSDQFEALSDAVSSDSANELQKLVPQRRERSDTLTEGDLKAERERRGKIEIAREMLGSGWSVRETTSELKLPKSLVERISKKLNAEERPTGGYRQRYLERPYQKAMEQEESEEDEEGLLSSGWIEKIQRKIWKMKIEQSLMKKAGLIGDDGDEKKSGSYLDLNQILIAKIVASGGNTNNQELISFATALKGLFAPQQADNFMERYAAMESIKSQGVEKYKEVTSAAYSQAKSESDKGFVKELVGKAIETVSPLLKNIATKPSGIPEATASIPPPMMPPTAAELERLSLPSNVPTAEVLQGVPVFDDSAIGYSNIAKPDISKKTELGR